MWGHKRPHRLGNLRGKISNSYKPVTQSQRYAYNTAKKHADAIVKEINDFFNDDWAKYKAYIDGLGLERVPKF